MGENELEAAYNHFLGEVGGLPKRLPEDSDDLAMMVEALRTIQLRANYVIAQLPLAAPGGEYSVGPCARCGKDQYQRPEGVRAIDTLGRTLQVSLINGCSCAWPA